MEDDNKKKYWNGTKNKIIRHYFYIQNGLLLFNEFRYLFAGIMLIYYALKLSKLVIIPIMFIVCSALLDIAGWYYVHHMKKVTEYLGIQFATHWARYQFELQEKQIKLLEEINEKLKDKKDS